MRARTFVALASLPLLLAGCTSSSTGTLALHVTDKPDAIGDFSALLVNVDKITLTKKDGGEKEYAPASGSFDLTKLTSGNLTTLFSGSVDAGNYTKLTMHLTSAKGTLAAGGTVVDVKTPDDKIFLTTSFEVASGKTTDFVFDVQVTQEGNGSYIFQPNASGSGPRAA